MWLVQEKRGEHLGSQSCKGMGWITKDKEGALGGRSVPQKPPIPFIKKASLPPLPPCLMQIHCYPGKQPSVCFSGCEACLPPCSPVG